MEPTPHPPSFEVHQVPASAYQGFARYHYRSAKLGPVAGAWCARLDRRDVAIVVYAYAGLAARDRRWALSKALWGGALKARANAINQNLRVLQRLVVLPEYRGRGVASLLVRRTLPLTGVPYIEAFARRPGVLQRAGMSLIAPNYSRTRPILPPSEVLCSVDRRIEWLASLDRNTRLAWRRYFLKALKHYMQSHGSVLRGAALSTLSGRAFANFWQSLAHPTHYLFWQVRHF